MKFADNSIVNYRNWHFLDEDSITRVIMAHETKPSNESGDYIAIPFPKKDVKNYLNTEKKMFFVEYLGDKTYRCYEGKIDDEMYTELYIMKSFSNFTVRFPNMELSNEQGDSSK
jgi:hypothetical protein